MDQKADGGIGRGHNEVAENCTQQDQDLLTLCEASSHGSLGRSEICLFGAGRRPGVVLGLRDRHSKRTRLLNRIPSLKSSATPFRSIFGLGISAAFAFKCLLSDSIKEIGNPIVLE